jgi:hypothetical protein
VARRAAMMQDGTCGASGAPDAVSGSTMRKTDADFLATLDRSPYAMPPSRYANVEGRSTLRGSWRPQAVKAESAAASASGIPAPCATASRT